MIPKIIWQTYKTPYPTLQSVDSIRTWLDLNPDHVWYYFDDAKCERFVRDHFDDEFYQMYMALPLGVMKADVWRVAVVYVYGGIYADLDTRCLVPVAQWIHDTDELIVGVETPHGAINNFVFAAVPRHPAVYTVLQTLLEFYKAPGYLRKDSPTPVQDFGAHAWSHGILSHYGLSDAESMSQGADYYNTVDLVRQEKTKFFSYNSNAFSPFPTHDTLVHHLVASVSWSGPYESWRTQQPNIFRIGKTQTMKQIKFVTTFSKNGYHVYGESWIESFLEFTKNYQHITAMVYVDGMDLSTVEYDRNRVNTVDFDTAIPDHKPWVEWFRKKSTHDQWNKGLGVKFSFKSFVIIDQLKNNNDCYVVWLDADCIFKSYEFDTFATDALQNNFMACQKESGSEHVESGIVIFDAGHPDKQRFLDRFESFYMKPEEFNSFGQFFDGYAIHRAMVNAGVSCNDLNQGHGLGGIQSDPDCTFMNPLLKQRFYHNIGITGKRKYQRWQDFVQNDPMFQLIHGANDPPPKTVEQIVQENLAKANEKIKKLSRRCTMNNDLIKTKSNIVNRPLVSIIIPCYNHARFVKDAIDSALNQTYNFVEIVIVNDGSTDDSGKVIQQYLHNSNIVYVDQQNTGLAIARNNGIKNSTGEIIICLDADDYIAPTYVEHIVANFENYRTIVTTNTCHTDEFLNLTGTIIYLDPTTYEELLKNNQINVCSGFSRKLFDEVGGYDPAMTRMGYEDWDLWIRMFKAGATATVVNNPDTANPFFRYRKHGNSMIDDSIKKHNDIVQYMNKKYTAQNFYMNPTYKTNPVAYFDDTELKDEWQNEVYLYAKDIVEQNNYKTVVDFGCGSGYKLIKYFDKHNTIGIDLPPTVSVLRERYPSKVWQDNLDPVDCDVLIASDVIEHMTDPNILLNFIEKCNPKEIILSTPDRNLHSEVVENGPPRNIHHVREWSFDEFNNYIESRFNVVNHCVTNKEQATQMIHARIDHE